jgi:Phage tail protein (Tail_P2_I)
METGWPVKNVTQRIYDALEPIAGPDVKGGWPLLAYIDAIGRMFQDAADLVQDGENGEVGWSIVLDIDRIPDAGLDWLAQFLGIRFYVGSDVATKRQQIRDHISWQRGTPAQVAASVRLFLAGTKTVQMNERNPTPYSFAVIIWAAEAPADTSPTSPLVQYVNAYAKPAGLKWTLTVNPGSPPATTYAAIYTRGDTYGVIYNSFQTYGDIR